MEETNGGLAFWATVGAGILVTSTAAAVNKIINDWEHLKMEFQQQFDHSKQHLNKLAK